MIRKFIFLLLFLFLSAKSAIASQGSGLDACAELSFPFETLAQMSLDTSLTNPPQVQLCHRAGNAERHFQMERLQKSISELRKFIADVEKSTPRHIEESFAHALITEAERVISIISGEAIVEGTISGGVFDFSTNQSIANASVMVFFASSNQTYSTVTDGEGLFGFKDMPLTGAFLVNALSPTGAVGTAQGSLLPGESEASVLVTVDYPGPGIIQGYIYNQQQQDANALVTAIFPESKKEYTTTVDSNGQYRLEGLSTDGTVIVIAFDNDSGASASYSTILTYNSPFRTVNLTLMMPTVINPELTNGNFADGLTGWTHSGSVQLINRDLAFSSQN